MVGDKGQGEREVVQEVVGRGGLVKGVGENLAMGGMHVLVGLGEERVFT